METFPVLIEIPQGTVNNKYEYDHKTEKLVLDFVFKNLVWPFNYGEIVGTFGGDGDALDAIVFSSHPLAQSGVVECLPFGIIKMLDRGEVDDKLMMIPAGDKLAGKYQDIESFSREEREAIKNFYAEVARQKQKTIQVMSFQNRKFALNEIKRSLKIKLRFPAARSGVLLQGTAASSRQAARY
ncbi:MAG: inorganic diphosphatase [Legionella sp.]|uniref:inorganic diphosphatase n=1 Tax=Legionella sp. TaxID=459 RepID=UPI00283C321B|nr:inorganic diphosphatase [Legionella sp.]